MTLRMYLDGRFLCEAAVPWVGALDERDGHRAYALLWDGSRAAMGEVRLRVDEGIQIREPGPGEIVSTDPRDKISTHVRHAVGSLGSMEEGRASILFLSKGVHGLLDMISATALEIERLDRVALHLIDSVGQLRQRLEESIRAESEATEEEAP